MLLPVSVAACDEDGVHEDVCDVDKPCDGLGVSPWLGVEVLLELGVGLDEAVLVEVLLELPDVTCDAVAVPVELGVCERVAHVYT